MSLINGIHGRPSEKQKIQILVHGLKAAGKTTMLDKLKEGTIETPIPSIDCNVAQFAYGNMSITAREVGGRDTIQSLKKQYYQSTDAIIFVVDSSDHSRLNEARDEVMRLMHESHLHQAALLVFANKQDLPHAMSDDELSDKLGLTTFDDWPWSVYPSCACEGDGFYDGLDWLQSKLAEHRKTIAKE